MSLERARKLAKVDTGIVASGEDPLHQTDEARGALTLSTVAERWMADHIRSRRKPKTADGYQQALDAYIIPLLGTLPMADVGQADAIRLHESLRETPTQANRVIRALSSLLTWSMRGNGRYRPLGHNPCFGIELYPETKRTRYLTPAEYAQVGAALRASTMAPNLKTAINLLLLTGARPIEIASLQWLVRIDRVLRLPTKTGAKTTPLGAGRGGDPEHSCHAHSTTFPHRPKPIMNICTRSTTHTWADLRDDRSGGRGWIRPYCSRSWRPRTARCHKSAQRRHTKRHDATHVSA